MTSIPMTTSTSSAAPSPSPLTVSEPVWTRMFAPSGTKTVAATSEVGILAYAAASDRGTMTVATPSMRAIASSSSGDVR